MMKCMYPPCQKAVTRPRAQYCSPDCCNKHWKERNRDHVNEQALAGYYERKARRVWVTWQERRAAIVAKYSRIASET